MRTEEEAATRNFQKIPAVIGGKQQRNAAGYEDLRAERKERSLMKPSGKYVALEISETERSTGEAVTVDDSQLQWKLNLPKFRLSTSTLLGMN